MGFSRQESWSGLPFPSPGDLPDLGVLHFRKILYWATREALYCIRLYQSRSTEKLFCWPWRRKLLWPLFLFWSAWCLWYILSQDCFDYLDLLLFHTNFQIICSTSVKNVTGILIRIVLNLQIALGSMDINSPNSWAWLSFHFFEPAFSFISVLEFSGISAPWSNLFLIFYSFLMQL